MKAHLITRSLSLLATLTFVLLGTTACEVTSGADVRSLATRDLGEETPEAVGMSSDRLARLSVRPLQLGVRTRRGLWTGVTGSAEQVVAGGEGEVSLAANHETAHLTFLRHAVDVRHHSGVNLRVQRVSLFGAVDRHRIDVSIPPLLSRATTISTMSECINTESSRA